MPKAQTPDAELLELIETHGVRGAAKRIGIGERAVQRRRQKIERDVHRQVTPPNSTTRQNIAHPGRLLTNIENGTVIIGSDAHYWPGIVTTAHRALVKFCKELKPSIVVLNGDVLDGASISRHPPISWEESPTLVQEIETCKQRLWEIEQACPKAEKYWTLGNHDGRFETRLATVAPEYANVHGVHLKDHFPGWTPCWSVWVNDCVVKHRFKGGIHATHNNTLWAGKHMVTGHLHSLKVTPVTDYNGTRYGVDSGTLSYPNGPMFNAYLEDNPVNWRSGFVVLTFNKGRLMWPEVVSVWDEGQVEFRGKVYKA